MTSHNRKSASSVRPIAITGATGQLGRRLCQQWGESAMPLTAQDLDLEQPRQISRVLKRIAPRVIVNTAAYTAVDAAERDPERCMQVNFHAVETMAELAAEIDCQLVQISTDYVFGGAATRTAPFCESEPVTPTGVYARSKALGEDAARTVPRHLVIRTCGIYGPPQEGASSNFVNTMLRLGASRREVAVVGDQVCCPTWVEELVDAIIFLVEQRHQGTFHVTNRGGVTWYELASRLFQLARPHCTAIRITSAEYNAPAPRPAYSALDVSKYAALAGPRMSTCLEAVEKYLSTLDASAMALLSQHASV